MANPLIKTTIYQYMMSSFDILIPGEKTITERVNFFNIEKDFDNDIFPILRINTTLKPDIYYKIMSNKTTVKFRVRIDKVAIKNDEPSGMKETVVNELFIMFTDTDDVFMDQALYKKTQDIQGAGSTLTDFKEPRDFYLFKEKDILASKKQISGVVSSSNMLTMVTYLLSAAGFGNMLMTSFDNTRTYNEIILLPVTVLKNIHYLDNQYGFYRYGRMMFFDWNVGYFTKRRGISTAYKPNEYRDVHVIVNKSANPHSMTSGTYKDNEKKIYQFYVKKDNVIMSNEEVTADQVMGNKITSINTTTDTHTTASTNTTQIGSAKNDVVVNKYNNEYSVTRMAYRRHENRSVLEVALQDIDIDAMMPTKRFIFQFEDSAVQKVKGGIYRLSGVRFDFVNQGTNRFSVNAIAVFRLPEVFVG